MRDWRIHCEFAQALIRMARRLYAHESLAVDLANTVYALDSTTIDLCLSRSPRAPFRQTKTAVKLHTLLMMCTANLSDRRIKFGTLSNFPGPLHQSPEPEKRKGGLRLRPLAGHAHFLRRRPVPTKQDQGPSQRARRCDTGPYLILSSCRGPKCTPAESNGNVLRDSTYSGGREII